MIGEFLQTCCVSVPGVTSPTPTVNNPFKLLCEAQVPGVVTVYRNVPSTEGEPLMVKTPGLNTTLVRPAGNPTTVGVPPPIKL